MMKFSNKAFILILVLAFLLPSASFAKRRPKSQPIPQKVTPQPNTQKVPFKTVSSKATKAQKNLEAAFSEKMKNSTLVGKFSVEGSDKQPQVERYEIKSATKMQGNIWMFQTRIKYGKVDTTLPIPVTLLWAGDTPMVSLTNATIPGMGTFSARVLFYGNRYAGTWQHGKKGGHMWGLIESENAKPVRNGKAKEADSASIDPNSSPIPVRLLNAKTKKVMSKTAAKQSPVPKVAKKKSTVVNKESQGWKKRETNAATVSSTKILKPAKKATKTASRPEVKKESKSTEDEIPAPPLEK